MSGAECARRQTQFCRCALASTACINHAKKLALAEEVSAEAVRFGQRWWRQSGLWSM